MGIPNIGLRTLVKEWGVGRKAVASTLEEAYAMNLANSKISEGAERVMSSGSAQASYVPRSKADIITDRKIFKEINNDRGYASSTPEPSGPTPGYTKPNNQYTEFAKNPYGKAPDTAIEGSRSNGVLQAGEGVQGILNRALKPNSINAGSMFAVSSEHAPWRQALAVAGNSLFKNPIGLGGLAKFAAPGIAGAAAGATVGGVGSIIFPGSIESDGFVKSAFKGAATGMAIGIAGRMAGPALKHVKKINGETSFLGESLGMVKSVGQSKLTVGAIGAASAAGAVNANLTRPISGSV